MNPPTGIVNGESTALDRAAPRDLGDAALARSTEGWRRRARRFAANPLALAGLVFAVVLVLAAIAAPLITPARYDDTRYVAQTYAFPSGAHLFGVDAVGRSKKNQSA